MSGDLPTHARVVIVGGGSIGCNIAYHLNKLGMTRCGGAGTRQADLGHHLARGG